MVREAVRWIPAGTEDRVERIFVKPESAVGPDTALLQLSNPELELAVLDASSLVKAAEAETTNLEVQLQSQVLSQEAEAASVQASYRQAKLQAEANEALAKEGLIANLTLELSRVTSDELENRSEIEK